MHVGADDIEADAAASQLRHGRGGGKTGTEKKFAQLAFGEFGGRDGRHRAHFDYAAASAIVFDFDENVIAAMIGADTDQALFGFSGALAGAAVFDAVGDSIAHEVNQL